MFIIWNSLGCIQDDLALPVREVFVMSQVIPDLAAAEYGLRQHACS
jgi:hypothetical protein